MVNPQVCQVVMTSNMSYNFVTIFAYYLKESLLLLIMFPIVPGYTIATVTCGVYVRQKNELHVFV
jgi:membrane protein DedA with SNARE-associated domain